MSVTKSAVSAVSVIFTEEILNGKLHFLCNVTTFKFLACSENKKLIFTVSSYSSLSPLVRVT